MRGIIGNAALFAAALFQPYMYFIVMFNAEPAIWDCYTQTAEEIIAQTSIQTVGHPERGLGISAVFGIPADHAKS